MKRFNLLPLFFLFVCAFPAHAQKTIDLKEVQVVASRTVKHPDGYVTSLRGTKIVKGKAATDVLGYLPNVSLEQKELKINGLKVSEIYVDSVKLSDLAELSNIPAEMIDKVRVKYIAAAGQNAAESGGVIMITLKQPSEGGYYGSLKAYTNWWRADGISEEGIGAMINYRYKQISLYDNIEIGNRKNKEKSEQWMTGLTRHDFIKSETEYKDFSFRNRFSITRQSDTGTQIGGNYYLATNRWRPSYITFADNLQSAIDKTDNITVQEGTARLFQPLGKRGASMELTADYFNRISDNHSLYYAETKNTGNIKEKNKLDQWKFKTEFIYPGSDKLAWKFGGSIQLGNSSYTPTPLMNHEEVTVSTTPTKSKGLTPIVFAEVQGTLGKISYSAGMNWQLNRITYEDLAATTKSHNTQWGINPTLQIMMPLDSEGENALMLNYKHTMSDIPYPSISKTVEWLDPYNYSVGNPNLKAEKMNLLMTVLSLFRNKINLTALYARINHGIYWQTFRDANNPQVFYTQPMNIGGKDAWATGVEWNETPTEWWQFKLLARLEITPEKMTIDNVYYHKTRYKEYFAFNNNFTLPHNWGGSIECNLEPTYRTYDRTFHSVYYVGGQIYKSFLKDKLQCSLDFTAFANRRKIDKKAGEEVQTIKFTSPAQFIGLTVKWNFSGGKKVNVDVVDGIQDYNEIKEKRQ